MRILVTGGAGFIGSHLVEKLLAGGHEVVILDDFNDFYDPQIKHANIADFAKDVTVCHVDLRENDSVRTVFGREKVDAIVHLAARAGVRPSIQYPRLYYDTNVIGTLHLLEAARSDGSSAIYLRLQFIGVRSFKDRSHFPRRNISRRHLAPTAPRKLQANFFARRIRTFTRCGS